MNLKEINMKKKPEPSLPKVTAKYTATRLLRGMGQHAAHNLAKGTAKTLSLIGVGDANAEIFSLKSIRKLENFWVEVTHLLDK